MPSSDVAIRSAQPEPKPIKLADERGLFLPIQPSGGKLWRLKYRIGGKEKKLSLGGYPDVGLKETRERAGEARKLTAGGTDPAEKKRSDRINAELRATITFSAVGEEYILKSERKGHAAVTVGKSRWLLSLFDSALSALPIDEISHPELLSALRKLKPRSSRNSATDAFDRRACLSLCFDVLPVFFIQFE